MRNFFVWVVESPVRLVEFLLLHAYLEHGEPGR
jgi:hypothetical protein